MKRLRDLALAVGLAVVGGLVSFLALLLFGLERDTAAKISAGILVGGIPYCYHLLSRWIARRRVAAEGPPTLASYSLRPVILILLGTLWMLGVEILVGALTGIGVGVAEVEPGAGAAAMAPLVLLILAWVAFCVGQWVGHRASRWAVAIAGSIVLLGQLIGKMLDYAFTPPDAYLSFHGIPREPTSTLLEALTGTVLLLVPAMVGVWRGTGTRPRSYITYILEILPKDTQRLLVEIAREEAHRVALSRASRSPDLTATASAQHFAAEATDTVSRAAAKAHTQWLHRGAVPVLSFVAGVVTMLITQAVASRQQLAQARRENRVTALRDYASACNRTAVSIAQLANVPLHLAGIAEDPFASREKQLERMYRLYDDALTVWRQNLADLAVQTGLVNALFQAKVDPIGATMKDVPPEFDVLPGEIDRDKLMKRMREDPLVFLKRNSAMLGRDGADLSSYCKASVQALSKEIE